MPVLVEALGAGEDLELTLSLTNGEVASARPERSGNVRMKDTW